MRKCEELEPGTKIKIVNAWWTSGLYDNGDVLIVLAPRTYGVLVKFDSADAEVGAVVQYIAGDEFEVIE